MLSKNFYHCSHCSTGPEYFSQKIFSSNTLFWMLVLPLTTFFKELMVGLLIFLTSLAAFKRFSAITHPATEPPGDVVTTSLLSPSNVVGTSQMKHPTTSQWNVAKTSQWYVFTTSYWYVVTTSQGNVMTTSHQYVSTTSQISLK